MVHAALLLLMLEAVTTNLVFTISLKRSTQNLQLSTSWAGRLPHLLVRLVVRWPRWFSATRVPNTPATFTGQWVPRIVSHLGSIDPTICLLLQLRLNRLANLADRLIS